MQELTVFFSNHPYLSLSLLIVFISLTLIEFLRSKNHKQNVSPQTVVQLINKEHAFLIDIRSPEAFQKGHIIDAQSIPSGELTKHFKMLEKNKTKPIVIICQRGIESQKIAPILKKQGYNTYVLSGGIQSWIAANLPIVRK